jgi:hypothetical protein
MADKKSGKEFTFIPPIFPYLAGNLEDPFRSGVLKTGWVNLRLGDPGGGFQSRSFSNTSMEIVEVS